MHFRSSYINIAVLTHLVMLLANEENHYHADETDHALKKPKSTAS